MVVLCAVDDDTAPNNVKNFYRQPAGIGRRLQHQGWYGRDQYRVGDTLGSMPADVACNLTAACRMADQAGVLKIERLDQRREIVGVGVKVVAIPGLAGPAVAAAIVGDAAQAA